MMSVVHNLCAMNAQRQFNITNVSQKKSTEKLSSGYKINRAADDAAGLTISEKMRSQIRGLTQASSNCQDGVSVCQIGDGALAEVHEMLHRCTELAVKSANGTNTKADRDAMQAEIREILSEIDSIAHKTEFNTLPLLLGEGKETTVKLVEGSSLPDWAPLVPSGGHMVDPNGDPSEYADVLDALTAKGTTAKAGAFVDFSNLDASNVDNLNGTGFHFTCCTCDHYYSITFNNQGKSGNTTSGQTTIIDVPIGADTATPEALVDKILEIAGENPNNHYTNLTKSADGTKLILYDNRPEQTASGNRGQFAPGVRKEEKVVAGISDIVIQAGASGKEENRIKIILPNITVSSLGIDGINISTQSGALNAIDKIESATDYVSNKRSMFGAYQNRLEHTILNLDNIVENTTSAESDIRDTDMAKEMVNYTRLNILSQAGMAMMSQSNQSTQGILQLLQ